jgi:thiol-disulfide isomerase/thioredoxin
MPNLRKRLKNKKWLVDIGLVIVILAIGALVYFQIDRIIDDLRGDGQLLNPESTQEKLMDGNQTPTPKAESENSQKAAPAPAFTLTSLAGDPVTLSDHRGQAVMINFWTTWCPPCLAELPLIESFAKNYAEELVVLAVNAGEERARVVDFVNEYGYDLLFLLDSSNSLGEKYQVRGLPTSVFIDQQGLIQAIHIGLLNEDLLSDYLSQVGVVQ